jgi:hypothetical protein
VKIHFTDFIVIRSIQNRKKCYVEERKTTLPFNKKLHHEPDHTAFEYEVLGGPTYSHSNHPPSWRNETSLYIGGNIEDRRPDMENMPTAKFPLIEDFEVQLVNTRLSGKSVFGYHITFFCSSLGYIAGFPWWDHVEQAIKDHSFQIPLGDFQQPLMDCEQAWEIQIAAKDDFVYILQRDFDAPIEDGYHTWFKVNQDIYLAEWEKAIERCRRTLWRDLH